MATTYSEIPKNFSEIESLLETDTMTITSLIIMAKKIFFYDTCSFRRHSNLSKKRMGILAEYYNKNSVVIVITRCILMELASDSGLLNTEYIHYLEELFSAKLKIILLDEENLFHILSECFSTNEKINEYLTWSVRNIKTPVSTITYTLENDAKLYDEVIKGKNNNKSSIYRHFFTAVRGNKKHSDNLGEELIGICLHILSYLPGINDGTLCVITDDKGAGGKIDSLFKRTNSQNKGARIVIFSTPKLVQFMYREKVGLAEEDLVEMLSAGVSGNITIMGTSVYDLDVNLNISMTSRELAVNIMQENGINIIF